MLRQTNWPLISGLLTNLFIDLYSRSLPNKLYLNSEFVHEHVYAYVYAYVYVCACTRDSRLTTKVRQHDIGCIRHVFTDICTSAVTSAFTVVFTDVFTSAVTDVFTVAVTVAVTVVVAYVCSYTAMVVPILSH